MRHGIIEQIDGLGLGSGQNKVSFLYTCMSTYVIHIIGFDQSMRAYDPVVLIFVHL